MTNNEEYRGFHFVTFSDVCDVIDELLVHGESSEAANWRKRAQQAEADLKRSYADEEMTHQRADRLAQRLAQIEESRQVNVRLLDELYPRLHRAEAQLATLKDKLKEWDVVGLLNTYACSATTNKLAALLAELEPKESDNRREGRARADSSG